jgi:MSHA pilin protein MshD
MVELVMSIVVIAVGMVGILKVMQVTTRHSADPMIQHQAVAIAEAYLDEIMPKSYTALPGTGSRDEFDDILDYAAYSDAGARDQFGQATPGLGGYTVSVAVGNPELLGGATVRRVDVTVVHAAGVNFTLSSYRSSY